MSSEEHSWLYLEEVRIGAGTLLEDFQKHLLRIVRPCWEGKVLCVKEFVTGITNTLVAIYLQDKGLAASRDEVVLLRLNGFGTEKIIDRIDELHCLLSVAKAGLGPKVYAQVQNGLCYGYIPGHQMRMCEVREVEVGRKVAQMLATLHVIPIPSHFHNRKPQVWGKMDEWLKEVSDYFEDDEKQKVFVAGIGSVKRLKEGVNWTRTFLSLTKSPIVFCHNDLLIANFIVNDETGGVHIVDYEYGGPNYLAFDIANHFCEFAGVDEVNYELYPDEPFQRKWLHFYLSKRKQLLQQAGESAESAVLSEEEIDALYKEVNRFTLASHLFWTVWALVQVKYSKIDFDYMRYAVMRYREYLRRKSSFSAL